MTYSLTSCLDTAPQTPFTLYVKHKINSMPSTRNCTQPLLIWKRHSIVYPDSRTCHLVGSLQVWHWGEAGMAHTKHVWKCRKQSACCLQPQWRVQRESGCSPSLLPEPPAVHYRSGCPIPTVPYRMSLGKPVCRCPGYHHWIVRGTTREADLLEDQYRRKGTLGQHG